MHSIEKKQKEKFVLLFLCNALTNKINKITEIQQKYQMKNNKKIYGLNYILTFALIQLGHANLGAYAGRFQPAEKQSYRQALRLEIMPTYGDLITREICSPIRESILQQSEDSPAPPRHSLQFLRSKK
uniref:Uncharacterized protein n=1 Tax=Glossina brevipalpis TaxID=37001 RepID=A0A1A9WTU9_9MUSC